MNYYNPYFNFPYSSVAPKSAGLFSRLLGGIKGVNWGNMFTNVQKTLNLVNQAIPVIKQVNPMIKNAKTMFHVMSEFNKNDLGATTKENSESKKKDIGKTTTKENNESKKNDIETTTTKENNESKKNASVTSDTKTSSKKPEPTNIEISKNSQGPTFFL